MTTRRKTPAPTTAADGMLAEIFASPEYQNALRERLVSGKFTAAEINLARSLGMRVPVGDGDDDARENIRKADRAAMSVLADLDRMAMSPDSTKLRVYQAGDVIGVVAPAELLRAGLDAITRGTAYQPPADSIPVDQTTEPTDEDLLP